MTKLSAVNIEKNKLPVVSDAKISEVTSTGYKVTFKAADDVEVTQVLVPTWTTANGQDDITWHAATKKSDGTYSYTVKIADHGNEKGEYISWIYAYDEEGYSVTKLSAVNIENTIPIVTCFNVYDINENGFTVSCEAVDDTGIEKVLFPVWTSKNNQDDIEWVNGIKDGNQYTATISISNHSWEIGNYEVMAYAYDALEDYGVSEKKIINIEKPSFINNKPIIYNVEIKNLTGDGYDISCNVEDDKQIDYVVFRTWTEYMGIDDEKWIVGTLDGNIASSQVDMSTHNYEFGLYNTEIYVVDIDGNQAVLKLPSINVKNTSLKNGWYYHRNKKYFFDQNGNQIGYGPAKKVIDVSLYNGIIDWDKVKEYGDVDGVIMRIVAHPKGSYIEDSQFANNLAACRRLNIPFGVYIYDYSNNSNDAFQEAKLVCSILKKYNITPREMGFPVYLDLERNNIDIKTYEQIVSVFVDYMQQQGYVPRVYSYRNLLNANLNSPLIWKYVDWVAAYTKTLGFVNPYCAGSKGWQYTSSGYIPGITGNVDISCWYND